MIDISFDETKQLHNEMFNTTDYLMCREMWLRIQDKQIPFLGELQARDKLTKKDRGIVDSAAWRANLTFAGGMVNGSVPQTVDWFDLASQDAGDEDQTLKEIIQARRNVVNIHFNNSNFYTAVHGSYLELPFGQSPVGTFFVPSKGFVFENYSIGSYAYSLDINQDVSGFAVKKEMTASQIAQKFGIEKLPDRLQDKIKEKRGFEAKENVYWLVILNPNPNKKSIGYDSKRFLSLYWLESANKFIHESGFDSCPIAVARYLAMPGSVYALGPGWFADSDTRIMYEMLKNAMGNMALFENPPLQAPSGVEVDYRPGAITELAQEAGAAGKVQSLFDIAPVFQQILEVKAGIEDKVNSAYNVNLFAMLEQAKFDASGRTAFEWNLRQQEKMQQLSPVITRINHEFLGKIIERVYGIIDVNGGFDAFPPQYEGRDIHINYISPLAQLQKMAGTQSFEMALAAIAQLGQIKPQAYNMLDEEEWLRPYYERIGAPLKTLRTHEEYQEILKQQAQAESEQKDMATAAQMAQPVESYTKAAANVQSMANDQTNAPLEQLLGELRQV